MQPVEILKEQGNNAFKAQQYPQALELYSQALQLDPQNYILYSNRSAVFIQLKNYELALSDADMSIKLNPTWAKGYHRKGVALFLLDKHEEAKTVLSKAHDLDPSNETITVSLEEVNNKIKSLGIGRKLRQVSDDFECVLCMKLFYNPVTTPCGHTFCKPCLARAVDHTPQCPMCRTVLHVAKDHPVNITLKTIIEKNFPEENKQRVAEVLSENSQTEENMPIFTLNSVVFPGQEFPMHIFEPRYRLMIRRCLEGDRKFGLVNCRFENGAWKPYTVGTCLEIKEVHVLEDGRSYINTKAGRRFKLNDSWFTDGYICAKVEWLDDQPQPAHAEFEKVTADKLRHAIVNLANTQHACGGLGKFAQTIKQVLHEMPADNHAFSFWLASLMPVSTDVKQAMLESKSTLARLQSVEKLLTVNPHA
eukprot:TRINITY_DN6072_c0_g1_i1.p1 TRINITY_DN6072_c0_g1~~TRINITY_DN6072_c0_g1_i1.p1  ORF type:complete len:420 (-),score=78.62 TRINITY_DN6072_c0_g1_i1:124-1383(-)